MRAIFFIICMLLTSSCVREDEDTTCFSYFNGTDSNIAMELYSFNTGDTATLID